MRQPQWAPTKILRPSSHRRAAVAVPEHRAMWLPGSREELLPEPVGRPPELARTSRLLSTMSEPSAARNALSTWSAETRSLFPYHRDIALPTASHHANE